MPVSPGALAFALAFVALAFAANSLITRHVVGADLLDAGLLSAVRFLAGALALALLVGATRGPRALVPGRRHAWPAFWLGTYALLISYGYRFIPASAGTFVFYAAVFVTLALAEARATRTWPHVRVLAGGGLALAGLGLLAGARLPEVTPLGVALLAGTGTAWGLYTAAGRGKSDPLAFTTHNFVALALALALPAAIGLAGVGDLRITAAGLAWATAMGAGTTAFAYVAWYACQPSITAGQAALHQLSVPLITAVGAVLLLGERADGPLWAAGALVVAGLALGAKR